jgi:hypothetical protein
VLDFDLRLQDRDDLDVDDDRGFLALDLDELASWLKRPLTDAQGADLGRFVGVELSRVSAAKVCQTLAAVVSLYRWAQLDGLIARPKAWHRVPTQQSNAPACADPHCSGR